MKELILYIYVYVYVFLYTGHYLKYTVVTCFQMNIKYIYIYTYYILTKNCESFSLITYIYT